MVTKFPRSDFSGGHIPAVLSHALEPGILGGYVPETGILFLNYDKWYPGIGSTPTYPYWTIAASRGYFSENSKGSIASRGRTFAHEVGHRLIDVESHPYPEEKHPTWKGGHDRGPYPRETESLMIGRTGGPKGKWLRHEDWHVAAQRARRLLDDPQAP